MARPTSPLVTRQGVIESALRIIDTEGLDALSIRRLGRDLGVTSAALYHHFSCKQEILVGAAELAIRRHPLPAGGLDAGDPEGLLVEGAHQLFGALNAHPSLLPIIIDRRRLRVADRLLDRVRENLVQDGYDRARIDACFDVLECLVVGTVYRTMVVGGEDDANGHPTAGGPAFDRAARGIVRAFLAVDA